MEPEVKYLEHSGILGMHWGLRRFQNPDGSLTPAGKERYAKERSKLDSKYGITKKQGDYIKGQSNKAKREKEKASNETEEKPKRKALSEMTNDEINEALTRLDLEKKYLKAITPEEVKEAETGLKKYAKTFGANMLETLVNEGSKKLAYAMMDAVSNKSKKPRMDEDQIDKMLSLMSSKDIANANNRKRAEDEYKNLFYGIKSNSGNNNNNNNNKKKNKDNNG